MTLHLDSLILSENKTDFLLDELCQERIEAVNLINIQLINKINAVIILLTQSLDLCLAIIYRQKVKE